MKRGNLMPDTATINNIEQQQQLYTHSWTLSMNMKPRELILSQYHDFCLRSNVAKLIEMGIQFYALVSLLCMNPPNLVEIMITSDS